ncbi:MAG: hypothetical protein WBG57_05415 [Ornithinimicrobium sp.]
MKEQPEPRRRRPGDRTLRELGIYAFSSVVVLYALAWGWVVFSTMNGSLSRTASVFGIIGLGLIWPVCTLSMRHALRLQEKQLTRREPGLFSLITWRPGPRLRGLVPPTLRRRRADQGARAPMSRAQALDVGMAITSAALFWAFWAGSLAAAVVVPVTVHWMRRQRA